MARKKRKSLVYRRYGELTRLEKFIVIMEIIALVHVTTLPGLMQCIGVAFGTAKSAEIKQLLSILVGSKRVERVDADFYVLARGAQSGLEFEGVDVRDVKSRVLLYYKKHTPHYYRLITEKRL